MRAAARHASIVDGFGSSETGAQGIAAARGRRDAPTGVTALHAVRRHHACSTTTSTPVEPGLGRRSAASRSRGHIPLGYYNDPEKTAETFVEVDGERWVLTGDMATVEDDGTITLLGRGSVCINTGGEKVFPEEVEAVAQGAPRRCSTRVVVGVPDERWGQRVAAVVQPRRRRARRRSTSCASTAAQSLAGYKVPRTLVRGRRGRALAGRQGRLPVGVEAGPGDR